MVLLFMKVLDTVSYYVICVYTFVASGGQICPTVFGIPATWFTRTAYISFGWSAWRS